MFEIAWLGQQHRKPSDSVANVGTLYCGFNPCRVKLLALFNAL